MDLYENLNLRKIYHKEGIKVNIKDDHTTSNGRRPQNMESWISEQPLIQSSSNLKLKPRRPNQNRKCFFLQILNFDLVDKSNVFK